MAVLAGSRVSAIASAVGHQTGLIGYVQEPVAWVLPSAVPDTEFWILVDATSDYLIAQAEAGAEVLQLFDSWAAAWEGEDLRRWCLKPAAEIVRRVKAAHPDVPVIVFPRGVGAAYEDFARESGADALSLDPSVPLAWARDTLQPHVCLQGNLDPQILVAGGETMRIAVTDILGVLGAGPFVFNLGHGIVPETPPEHVAELVAQVRAWTPGA